MKISSYALLPILLLLPTLTHGVHKQEPQASQQPQPLKKEQSQLPKNVSLLELTYFIEEQKQANLHKYWAKEFNFASMGSATLMAAIVIGNCCYRNDFKQLTTWAWIPAIYALGLKACANNESNFREQNLQNCAYKYSEQQLNDLSDFFSNQSPKLSVDFIIDVRNLQRRQDSQKRLSSRQF